MLKKILITIYILLAIGIVYGLTRTGEVATETVIEQKANPDLENIMNEADFKKMIELKARKTLSERQKVEENRRHDESINKLEADLEQIRKEELELGKATSL